LLTGKDIVPTVLEAARLEVPAALGGVSFLPAIQAQTQTNRHEYLSWQRVEDDGKTHQAVREAQWKAVQPGADQPWQLFNLATDPGEETDLAKQRPEVVEKLKATLEKTSATGPGSSAAAPAG